MSNVTYYIQIPARYFRKETDKAYCFQFEDASEANIPKSQIKRKEIYPDSLYIFELPQWLIEANDLEYYVQEDLRPYDTYRTTT